jgi:hypothetical protein
LAIDGGDLRLSGNAVLDPSGAATEVRAPAAEFLVALYDCGRRALALLQAQLDDPAALGGLAGLAAETTAVLAGTGWI